MDLTRNDYQGQVDVLYTSLNLVRSCPDISSGPTSQVSLSVNAGDRSGSDPEGRAIP